jgi:hypothetical protein
VEAASCCSTVTRADGSISVESVCLGGDSDGKSENMHVEGMTSLSLERERCDTPGHCGHSETILSPMRAFYGIGSLRWR